jgi:hypothetical protein
LQSLILAPNILQRGRQEKSKRTKNKVVHHTPPGTSPGTMVADDASKPKLILYGYNTEVFETIADISINTAVTLIKANSGS